MDTRKLLFNMKLGLLKKSNESDAWNKVYYLSKYNIAKVMHRVLGDEGYAKWFYHFYTGKTLNLENPTTFNDKLWWIKLYDRDPMMTRCADKFKARFYVAECGYPEILVPCYDVLDTIDDLDVTKYKHEFVAKCTHNSGSHLFYNPENPPSKEKLDKTKKILAYILKQDPSALSLEWHYKNIKPRIIVEKVLRDSRGNLPLDYRFFCFDGEPKFLMMDIETLENDGHGKDMFDRNMYDMNFEFVPFTFGRAQRSKKEIKKPENFEKMIEIASKLSSPFPACRVDLYNIDGAIYFGEITFFHSGASQNIFPEEWATTLGSWIDLNSDKIVRKSD